ncbi:heme-binding beta-barrel domain-containing protein [Vibrio makurazakiensis]|uniref:heme-binding beta-barrel domain-containing protein n=1 Tax=Vibrio makurazakiensis TaxID=2910250 RepID=UPI003D0DC4B3
MKKMFALGITAALSMPVVAQHTTSQSTVINGLDFGPLAQLVGTWKSADAGGVDVAPGQENSAVGEGNPSVTPFYEVMTFEVAADATNASEQYLVALYYKQEVFRKKDDSKFHDQRGYFIYDKENQTVYNSFCVPRTTCVTAEGKAGNVMTLKSSDNGIAESNYMLDNAATEGFTMSLNLSEDQLTYSQTTELKIYGEDFTHTDASTLYKVK